MATDHRPAEKDLPEQALLSEDVDLLGRMPWSSNATFLVKVGDRHAIYKPGRGERPLWDFPGGLYRREVAAYELAKALGWGFVPETVIRKDAPLGEGSLQLFIEADFDEQYFTLLEEEKYHDQLQRIACFDVLANNADRKAGHCLLGAGEQIWGIDHGLCFHPEYKLRTVIWDFVEDPIPEDLLKDVRALVERGLPAEIKDLLGTKEQRSLLARAELLLGDGHFPMPRNDHPYPWPLV